MIYMHLLSTMQIHADQESAKFLDAWPLPQTNMGSGIQEIDIGPSGEEGLHSIPSLPTSGAAAFWNLPAVSRLQRVAAEVRLEVL